MRDRRENQQVGEGMFRPLYLGLFCSLLLAANIFALEPWVDTRLPVRAGLECWYDATTLPAATRANEAATLSRDLPVGTWYDGSGKQRHARQGESRCQPIWHDSLLTNVNNAVVRFDGQDDYLSVLNLRLPLSTATIFMVTTARANPGDFRAWLALCQRGVNDYVSGLNIDLGPGGSGAWDTLNIEGKGFGGARALWGKEVPFGAFRVLTATLGDSRAGVRLFVQGQLLGERPRDPATLNIQQLYLGARCYRNDGQPPDVRGFLAADIAEVLIYQRELSNAEREAVEAYLTRKHAGLLSLPGLPIPPVLQVLEPGFQVRELPVRLSNINDVLYLPDGRLLALGYDGQIHELRDTDGDGLEDSVTPYWTRPTLRVPLNLLHTSEGVYVTSTGKVSRLLDTNNDGKPDREEIVASGWPPPDVSTNGVDALGLARDHEGNIYFGLGCADYTNAYRIRDGATHFRLTDERGTIVRLDRHGKRHIISTGIRFPVTLAFNRQGDLFCTDQEGETWLPGGNPLDELNHIQPGRHYGFPPRHPKHLSEVRDEPPVVGFGPQHQSTCGLAFLDPHPQTGKRFGPLDWDGDALVAGYSRGKLWRTRLTKTPSGYLGKASLLAAARLLLMDATPTPTGALLVVCHSGAPDWGSGPNGPGKLFQITSVPLSDGKRHAPRLLAAWSASPLEVRLTFDQPVSPGTLRAAQRAIVEWGAHARAGDRWEVLRPGYQSVVDQQRTPRGKLRVVAARLHDDGHTLALNTDPHPARGHYAVQIPGVRGLLIESTPNAGSGEATIATTTVECDYDLSGFTAQWTPALVESTSTTTTKNLQISKHSSPWQGWLPHVDINVALALTRGAITHQQLANRLQLPGIMELRGRLDLPHTATHMEFISSHHFQIQHGATKIDTRTDDKSGLHRASWIGSGSADMILRLTTGPRIENPWWHMQYHTAEDTTIRPIPFAWLSLPWAPLPHAEPNIKPAPAAPHRWAGGNARRGRDLFFGKEANCSACHRIRDRGALVGPDLSNLIHRDHASVYRDIADPSAVINPDYVPYTVLRRDGQTLNGLVRAEGLDKLRVVDSEAKETVLAVDEVEMLRPANVSVMPKGMDQKLGPEKIKDLLAFLLAPPAAPGNLPPAPPNRKRSTVEALLKAAPPQQPAVPPRPLKILLVASKQDHGPGEHDYPRWQTNWQTLLGKAAATTVDTAFPWPKPLQWQQADVVIFYFWNHEWSEKQLAELDAHFARGGGAVFIHAAVIADREPHELARRIGLAAHFGPTKYRHGPLDLTFLQSSHPIAKGFTTTHFLDESYWPLVGELGRVEVLNTAEEEGKPRPISWTYSPSAKGRVFATILGHYSWTFDDPLYRILLLRGLAWSAGLEDGRFIPLVTDGVEFLPE